MKIVIDIPECYYDILKKKTAKTANEPKTKLTFMGTLCEAVGKGTPLTEVLEDIRTDIEGLKHEHTDVSGYRWWDNAIVNVLNIINSHTETEE